MQCLGHYQGRHFKKKSPKSRYLIYKVNLTMDPPQRPVFNYTYESQAERLARKSKDSPFMIIGLTGLAIACVMGAYKFKNKGKMSTSVYLMQLRVIAQGTVVGALTCGLAYNILREHVWKQKPE